MYRKGIILLAVFVVLSCNQKKNLDDNFKKYVIEYQKRYPVPSLRKKNYIYIAYFDIINKDTIFILSRSSNGLMPGIKGFGVFNDEVLQPTFVYDNNNLSQKIIYARVENKDAKNFYLDLKKGIKESYPPIYTFLIKNKKIELIKIDTIWRHWD